MIPAFGGEQWWPLNSEAVMVRARPDRIADALNPTGQGIVARFDDLAQAVAARAPYPYGREDTTFLIGTADEGTVALSSAAPGASLFGRFRWPAQHVLHCEYLAAQWTPRHRSRLASAGFDHLRPGSPSESVTEHGDPDQLTVQVSDQGRRWVFVRVPPGTDPPERPYEERDVYRRRLVAERVPLDLIRRYLRAGGIPIDDSEYLTGPVMTVSLARRLESDVTWSTMLELRTAAGYPASGIPADLRALPADA